MNAQIESIKTRLLIKYPLFGSILANTKFIEDKTCYSNGIPTCGTDGKCIYYHPDCLLNASDDEQLYYFAHETFHIAFDHTARSDGKDPEIWNIATDAVGNAFLKKDGIQLEKRSIDMPEAINYNAEELYEKLLAKKKQQNQKNGNQSKDIPENRKTNNDKSSSKDVGHDTHTMWGKSIQKKQQEDTSNKLKEQSELEKTIEQLTKLGEKEAFKQNKIERKKQLEQLRDTLIHDSQKANSTSGQIEITGIGAPSTLVDWRYALKEVAKCDVDWSYQNATIEEGVVTPHLEEIPRPKAEILLDTSGSISIVLLRNFLKECKNILQETEVSVGCFDDVFYGFTEIKDEADIDKMTFVGGGGTNFTAAVKAFTKRAENKIIFTDGKADMPDIEMDIIWIVFGNQKISPKGGRVIYIPEDQIESLIANMVTENQRKVR